MRRFGIVLMTLALGAAGAGSSQLPPVAKSSPIPATGAPGGGMVGVLASGALETANPSALETPKADTSLGIPTAAANAKRVPGSFIVALAPGQDPSKVSAEIAREYGGEAKFVYDHVIHGFAFSGPDDARQRLAADPRVTDVQPDFEAHVAESSASVHLQVDDAPGGGWYTLPNKGSGVRIGILDTGVVEPTHPAIKNNLDLADSDAHCVQESSITGGSPHGMRTVSNAVGTIGTAPLAHAVVVKVFPGTSPFTKYSTIACGINYIVGLNQSTDVTKHVQVVNASIAGPTEVDKNGIPTTCSQGMHKAVCQLVLGTAGPVPNAPAAFFAAAGNASCTTCSGGDAKDVSPGNFHESISVSGFSCPTVSSCTTSTPNFAVWSYHGGTVALGAPGEKIQSASTGGSIAPFTGTSRAAPQAAGAAADLLSVAPGLTPDQVRKALQKGGRCPDGTTNGSIGNCTHGAGWPGDPDKTSAMEPLLDVAGAIASLVDQNPTVTITSPIADQPVPPTFTVNVSAQDDRDTPTVQLSVDGGVAASMTCTGSGTSVTCSKSITGLAPDGTHSLTAQSLDAHGQSSTPMTIHVTVKSTPIVSFVSPTNNASVSQAFDATISASAFYGLAGGSPTLTLDPAGSPQNIALKPTSGTQYVGHLSGLSVGPHTLRVAATDAHAQSSTADINVTVSARPSGSSLTRGTSGAGGTSVPTASITPTAKSLELAAIIARSTSGNATPTLTGCGRTWDKVSQAVVSASSPYKQLTLFRAQFATAPSSPCALTFDFGTTPMTNFAWSVTEYSGVHDDSPSNGLGAVRQPTSAVGNSSAASVGLPSPFLSRSGTFGVAANSNSAPQTPGPGFLKLDEQTSGGGICTFWRSDSSSTVGSSWTASTHWGVIGLEIVAGP